MVENNVTLANGLFAIAAARKDCVAFVSPAITDTVGSSTPTDDVKTFADQLTSTSYGVIDSTALKVYDKYNDTYRWIGASGHMAGLCANTDNVADAWFSPAGFTRGQLLGVTKIAFNPKQADRDTLYKARINPIVAFPGQGIVLYGDKTAQAKPSAFDRINVRRLFIVLEKAVATAAKFQLFEFNDEFTRAMFRNMVEPFLRDVKGRRGITDFAVVCDETNNTGDIIDTNQFVADIYIKPARSINFITLNFIATRTGVEFSEIIGQ
jgi:phage tail sheath protein FI